MAEEGDCSSCNSSNDDYLFDADITTTDQAGFNYWALPFNIATDKCVSAIMWEVIGNGVQGDAYIYTDVASEPGSPVSGMTGTIADLGSDRTEQEFELSSSALLPDGDYFIVLYCDGCNLGYQAGGSSNDAMYSTNGSDWTPAALPVNGGVLGCSP